METLRKVLAAATKKKQALAWRMTAKDSASLLAYFLLPIASGDVFSTVELAAAFTKEWQAPEPLAHELATRLREHYSDGTQPAVRDLCLEEGETILQALLNLDKHSYLPPAVLSTLQQIPRPQILRFLTPAQKLARHKVCVCVCCARVCAVRVCVRCARVCAVCAVCVDTLHLPPQVAIGTQVSGITRLLAHSLTRSLAHSLVHTHTAEELPGGCRTGSDREEEQS
jgi:hypothetical protein